jgi:hypothetical protein
MSLYHPRLLAQKLEDLVLKLLSWSHSVIQVRHAALGYQSKMELELAGESRAAGILAAQLGVDAQEMAQADAMLVEQTAYYFETKAEGDQACEAVQQAYTAARQTLAYWQAQLVQAEQAVGRAMETLQYAESEYARVVNASLRVHEAVERTSDEDVSYLREVEARVKVVRRDKKRAEKELSSAQVRASNCTSAVKYACEAIQVVEEAQQYSQQGTNALGRSHEHVVAAQKAFEEGKAALKREEEAVRAAEEVVEGAQKVLDDAAESLQTALLHEQASQGYQTQARAELEGKIQALFALNQADYNFSAGGAIGDPLLVDGTLPEGAVGAEVSGRISALDDTTALLERGYTGPKSDLELQPLVERLLQKRELVASEWWSKLKMEKRVEVLRKVHKDIARAYGFTPCQIEVYSLRPKLHGVFNEHMNRIILNRDLLVNDHPMQALNTLAHESRHAYQYHAIQQYTWTIPAHRRAGVKLWKANWQNYQVASEGYEDYYKQPIEVDARAFAAEVISNMYRGT